MDSNNILEDKGFTFVFETNEEMAAKPSKFRRKIWRIFPSVCGTMMVLPFGIMLGWPSPTYPNLIDEFNEKSPIPITIDQSAMVAGFLMIGNTVATPFSSFRRLDAKYGIIFAVVLMTIGWILMWQAKDIYWLLASRFLIGAGQGFGIGQLKYYISEICQDSLAQVLIKQTSLYVFAGVILAYAYGPFVEFRLFSIISTIISIFVLFLAIFLPSTPRDLLKSGKVSDARKLLLFLSPHVDVTEQITKIKEDLSLDVRDLSFCDIMREAKLRRNFFVLALLVFCQQFSGIPSTIVYSQTIFKESGSPQPEFCALIYSCVYFLANAYGIFCVPNLNKKHVFLISSISVSLLLVMKVLVIVRKLNETLWSFTSLIVLILFNVAHTVGLGSVPVSLIPNLFPNEARKVVVHFVVMWHSMLALIITKIFQVMFDQIGLYAPFCLFFSVSTFSIVIVIIFVPNKKKINSNA